MSNKENQSRFYVDGRVFINAGNFSFVGQGKIELIEKIRLMGSLRKAALAMRMSYSQSWSYVNKINKLSDKPLVILKRGGKNGGIAQVTAFGDKVINTFNQIQKDFKEFLAGETQKLNF
jgi:molybdate transport system regulatory protein